MIGPIKAGEATGIDRVPGTMTLYKAGGGTVTPGEARALLEEGNAVECPQAGSGSYREFAELVGLEVTEVIDWTSSAGDWALRLADGRALFQENRHPYRGFKYSIGAYHHE